MYYYISSLRDVPLCRPISYRWLTVADEPFFADENLGRQLLVLLHEKGIERCSRVLRCNIGPSSFEIAVNIFDIEGFIHCRHAAFSTFCNWLNRQFGRSGAVFCSTPAMYLLESSDLSPKARIIVRKNPGPFTNEGNLIEGKFS